MSWPQQAGHLSGKSHLHVAPPQTKVGKKPKRVKVARSPKRATPAKGRRG